MPKLTLIHNSFIKYFSLALPKRDLWTFTVYNKVQNVYLLQNMITTRNKFLRLDQFKTKKKSIKICEMFTKFFYGIICIRVIQITGFDSFVK